MQAGGRTLPKPTGTVAALVAAYSPSTLESPAPLTTIVAIITSAFWIGFFVNGRYGCLPLVFIRFVNDKSFLAEYERRLDKVVEHDLKKKYHVGRKLGEGFAGGTPLAAQRSWK